LAYEVRIERQACRTLEKLERGVQRRIATAIRGLADDPRPAGSRKLKNREVWRIRVGDYRVIYGVNDKESIVLVAKIDHRRDVYRRG
jgi:mRNA interferase RelE/StbE